MQAFTSEFCQKKMKQLTETLAEYNYHLNNSVLTSEERNWIERSIIDTEEQIEWLAQHLRSAVGV